MNSATVSLDDKRVAVCSFGGTIAMAQNASSEAGVTPSLEGEDLCAALPDLRRFGNIECRSFSNVGSPSVTFEALIQGIQWADQAVKTGAMGTVCTHGTDTMEESLFFADLVWPHSEPIVFTGAMRSPEEPGADGPANLLDAFIVAESEQSRGLGALLVFNNEVFDAKSVTKTHAFAIDAFKSPWLGPLGRIHEGHLVLNRPICPKRSNPLMIPKHMVNVPIISPTLGCDGMPLEALIHTSNVRGIVFSGMGAGHVPQTYLPLVDEAIANGITLVMATRTGGGMTGTQTYGYPGAEIDLQQRDVIFAGSLQPLKARLLLSLLLSNGVSRKEIEQEFRLSGQSSPLSN